MQQAGVTDFGLPELDEGEYLPGVMFDLGPSRSDGMGAGPTDWDIIGPFGEAVGLDSEDMMILAKMCRGYHEARREGEHPLTIAPVDRD